MKYDLEIEIKYFNLKYTLECGQCFRWEKVYEDEKEFTYEYIGVIEDRVLLVKQQGDMLYVKSNKVENLKEIVSKYFDLYKEYDKIEQCISRIDKNIEESIRYSSGMRMLNQAVFETIISYIISANNNIKRISKSVNEISKRYGKKAELLGKEYYLFPTIEELSNADVDSLLACGVGFRARYIKNTVKEIMENPEIMTCITNSENTIECIKDKLMKMQGIGPKVADCIMLFSLERSEVFPIDVWVKRIMEKLYFNKNTDMKDIRQYARDNFREYSRNYSTTFILQCERR